MTFDTMERCACHLWYLRDAHYWGARRCRRCRVVPVFVRLATLEDRTVCEHTGPCKRA